MSGTFVSRPCDTEADCLRKIAEIDPLRAKAAKMKPAKEEGGFQSKTDFGIGRSQKRSGSKITSVAAALMILAIR